MPMVPVTPGPRSERMSPNRLDPTTTSKALGPLDEVGAENVDVELIDPDVRVLLRHFLHPLVQYGMVMEMPLTLVAEVRCFFGRERASSKRSRGCGPRPCG